MSVVVKETGTKAKQDADFLNGRAVKVVMDLRKSDPERLQAVLERMAQRKLSTFREPSFVKLLLRQQSGS